MMIGKMKLLGLAVLGFGLVLGGCNGKLKEENAALREQQAELKERAAAAESEKQAAATQLSTLQSENMTLKNQLATASQPQQPMNYNDGMSGGGSSGGGRSTGRSNGGGHVQHITISSDVLFASGSATLKPEARRELDKYMSQFKRASSIKIEGHTDSDPIRKSKWGSNQALSKGRADAVRDYLTSKGVSSSKIDTIGRGSTEPKKSKKDSRRVEIAVAD
jgi:outer membrane protein OmpA-like peptidoglycan-associated protein